jgi:hypothetical protein
VSDGWLGYGINWDTPTPAPVVKRKRPETDAELRDRLYYVAGEGQYNLKRIQTYTGSDLDTLADEFSLKRRMVDE